MWMGHIDPQVLEERARRPRTRHTKPVPCPQTSPLLNILGNTPGAQSLVYADAKTPDSKAKAKGATALQLFVAVTDRPNALLGEARYRGKFTKTPFVVEFESHEDGKYATYWARWVTRRGENGPWSLPVSMVIAA